MILSKLPRCWTAGITAVALSVVVAGCVDEAADEARKSRETLEQVLVLVKEAEQGYVPNEEKHLTEIQYETPALGVNVTERMLSDFRRKKLQEAATALEGIKDKGRASEQIATKRLLSQIYATFARDLAQQAQVSSAEIIAEGSSLWSHAIGAKRMTGSARAVQTDESELLTKLRDFQGQLRGELTQLQRKQEEWENKISDYEAQIAKQKQIIETANAKSTQLREQAFQLRGERRSELMVQAIDLETKAANAGNEIERLRHNLDVFRGEKSIIDKKIASINDPAVTLTVADRDSKGNVVSTETVSGQIKSDNGDSVTVQTESGEQQVQTANVTEARFAGALHSAEWQIQRALQRQDSSGAAVEAMQRKIEDDALKAIAEKFTALTDRYAKRVDAKFKEAIDFAQKSANNAEAATKQATGNEQTSAKYELLARRSDLAYIRKQHASSLSLFGEDLTMLAERGEELFSAGRVEQYRVNADRYAAQAKEAEQLAAEAIDQALADASALASSVDDQMKQNVALFTERLQMLKHGSTDGGALEGGPVVTPEGLPGVEGNGEDEDTDGEAPL